MSMRVVPALFTSTCSKLEFATVTGKKMNRPLVLGAREGAIKGTIFGGTLMTLAHMRSPLVRRQTLAGKAFVASWFSIFFMVIGADRYLLDWEKEHRVTAERWRDLARRELSARGSVPTETAMRAWKVEHDAKLTAVSDSPLASSASALSSAEC